VANAPGCGGNTAPTAVDDAYDTPQDTVLSVEAPGVLGNDTDADGDDLTAVLSNGPSFGSVSLNADGSFAYRPNSGFTGSDDGYRRARTLHYALHRPRGVRAVPRDPGGRDARIGTLSADRLC